MQRYVDRSNAVRVKALRGTLGLAEKRRERMLDQLTELQCALRRND